MARAIWSGALSFGLVAMPVQLFTATRSHTIRFNQIQRGTADRVRNKRVNERTGDEVPMEEVVKGFEMGDEYVVVEPNELDEIAPGRSKGLEISGFVGLDELDPIYFDRSYYLAPKGPEYAKVYSLLLDALVESHKVGIATFVMRNREYLVAVRAEEEVLTLHTLHWADEVRDPRREIGDLPERVDISTKELRTAVQLVEALSMEWHPEEFHDTYQERVLELVEAKRTGATIEKGAPPPRSTNVIDLMDALQASVDSAQGRRGERGGEGGAKRGRAGGKRAGGAAKRRNELDGLSKSELYERASRATIPGRSSMNREELIRALSA
ncbi:Ku protein [Streptomyces hainanensis]|uniref:Non-homologous end joining protein Ku n=1 Tax=Streptomyces hainanensis TaxID=402648 RepID=A0A4R4SIH1_9ACTN|nr:Ku protein [Streptomyces hainanensis]TDC62194.1 Ku protein [Streptomyces hainanensis]